MDVRCIDHVAVSVRDLPKAASWYEGVFGFGIVHKWQKTWMVGNEKMRIGLFLREDALPVDDLDNRIAIQHFAFLTDKQGFADAQSQLQKLGIKSEGPEDSGIAYSIFIKDADGHQVELTTYYNAA